MDYLPTLSAYIMANFDLVFPMMAVFTRMSTFVFLLPGLGEKGVTPRHRLIIAMLMTWLITPLVGVDAGRIWSVDVFTIAIALEALHGFILGFAFRVMVYGLQVAGSITSQSLSLSQVFGGGMTTEPNTTIATILIMTGVTLLVTLDLHIRALGMMVSTYETFPMGSAPDTSKYAYWATETVSRVFAFAVALALPFLLLNFVYNLMIGFVNKAMPQLMVSFVGLPFITGAGIFLLAISIGGMLTVWVRAYDAHLLGF